MDEYLIIRSLAPIFGTGLLCRSISVVFTYRLTVQQSDVLCSATNISQYGKSLHRSVDPYLCHGAGELNFDEARHPKHFGRVEKCCTSSLISKGDGVWHLTQANRHGNIPPKYMVTRL